MISNYEYIPFNILRLIKIIYLNMFRAKQIISYLSVHSITLARISYSQITFGSVGTTAHFINNRSAKTTNELTTFLSIQQWLLTQQLLCTLPYSGPSDVRVIASHFPPPAGDRAVASGSGSHASQETRGEGFPCTTPVRSTSSSD